MYIYIYISIFGKKTEDADETNDAKLGLRGGKMKNRCSDIVNQGEEHFSMINCKELTFFNKSGDSSPSTKRSKKIKKLKMQ